jgi:multiple sugar transport system ATP-binding protein
VPGAAGAQASPDIPVGVRPQNLAVLNGADAADLALEGRVSVVEPLGSEAFVHVEAGERLLVASAPRRSSPRRSPS